MSVELGITVPPDAAAFFKSPGVIGVTGHRLNRLTPEHEAELARIAGMLFGAAQHDVILLSCLAEGVDTILAEAWPMSHGLSGLLPKTTTQWRSQIEPAIDPARFDRLVARSKIFSLGQAGEIDFADLARALVDRSDRIFAVWDGEEGKPGGTGSVVARACALGKPVLHLEFTKAGFRWPQPSILGP